MVFGYSSQKIPIIAYQFGVQGPEVLVLGGVHGNEPEGVMLAHFLVDKYSQRFSHRLRLTIIPSFNIDGVLLGKRQNANSVDLNRNLPTNDWTKNHSDPKYFPGFIANSESENQALVEFIKNHKLKFILSLHSWYPLININGSCEEEANILKKMTGYEIKKDIGYPTPGCLGTYSGLEREIPTITYEVERGLAASHILKTHCPAIDECLKVTETREK